MNIKQRMAEAAQRGQLTAPTRLPRPRLRADNIEEYLDWLTRYGLPSEVETGLKAAELVVRLRMGEAQAKTTHADLIRDGVIDPATVGG